MSGGQWTQSRLASVRKFTDDARCQLCLMSEGTLEHRYHCPVSRPADGWITDDADAAQIITDLPEQQRYWLITRGLLFHSMPAAPEQRTTFQWLMHPGPDIDSDEV